nr:hypothetical protein [Tanacetum cinerariifolium]
MTFLGSLFVVGLSGEEHGELCGSGGVELSGGNGGKGAGGKIRNKNILTGKWTPMNRDVQKFNAIYNQTELLSGENEENLYTQVLTLFRDQHGVEFRHLCLAFLKDKYKWTNPESTQARRTRGRVTGEDEPEMFGEDAIPRPSGARRKSSTFLGKLIRHFRFA